MNKDNGANILPPDWSYWGRLKTATLFQAVLLSFDICPDWFASIVAKDNRFQPLVELGDKLLSRLRICENRADEFDRWLALLPEENRSRGTVNLATFGSWARTVWGDIPGEFPLLKSEPVATFAEAQQADLTQPLGPNPPSRDELICSKKEVIDGFVLTGKNWTDILNRPDGDGRKYSEAIAVRGRRGDKKGTLYYPVILARLLIENGDLNAGQVEYRFKRSWPKWEAEMKAEIGGV